MRWTLRHRTLRRGTPRHWPTAIAFLGSIGTTLALALSSAGCHRGRTPDALAGGVQPPRRVIREERAERARLAGEGNAETKEVFGIRSKALYDVLVGFPLRLWNFATGKTPLSAAVEMEDSRNADRRRAGILKLADYPFGRQGPYVNRYKQKADQDPDPTVRAAAIRALDRARNKDAVPIYLRGLDNEDTNIRLESAKALANVPDERAVTPLIAHLNNVNENKDVRISCADALRSFPRLEAARALVGVLQDREFGISWQARKSLNLLTHHDFHYDDQAWLSYFSSNEKPFKT